MTNHPSRGKKHFYFLRESNQLPLFILDNTSRTKYYELLQFIPTIIEHSPNIASIIFSIAIIVPRILWGMWNLWHSCNVVGFVALVQSCNNPTSPYCHNIPHHQSNGKMDATSNTGCAA
jgi:hypothetical protein